MPGTAHSIDKAFRSQCPKRSSAVEAQQLWPRPTADAYSIQIPVPRRRLLCIDCVHILSGWGLVPDTVCPCGLVV